MLGGVAIVKSIVNGGGVQCESAPRRRLRTGTLPNRATTTRLASPFVPNLCSAQINCAAMGVKLGSTLVEADRPRLAIAPAAKLQIPEESN
jgi:hypothetical protein